MFQLRRIFLQTVSLVVLLCPKEVLSISAVLEESRGHLVNCQQAAPVEPPERCRSCVCLSGDRGVYIPLGVLCWVVILALGPTRIAVFSVTVLHDDRIVLVAEQRPDASEEDSFQWMSRVLQVGLRTCQGEALPPSGAGTRPGSPIHAERARC